ncbi:MAG: ribosome biogenesis GTPase Der [Clostridia bacterium]|nr:ribosome biogenesis GTPase Der [Clostridia bacterium]
MNKPLVAVVGKPNVGKSTLFNKITGKKVSIVEDTAGVTRDRVYCDAEWRGRIFTLIDTGGLEINDEDSMWRHIRAQADIAVDLADVIVFVTDGKAGISSSDREVAQYLRSSAKPIVLAVNKLDVYSQDKLFDFYEFGFDEVVGVSAEQGTGIGDLLDEIVTRLPEKSEAEDEDDGLKIAVVGKPNAGKSSIVNKILGYDRVIVSDVAGTTRDAIDTAFTDSKGRKFTIIDTAGMRKKSNVDRGVEQYSVIRALGAVRRADISLIVLDAGAGISEQDVKICGYVHDNGKPSVIVMNKWDTVEKDTRTINVFNKNLEGELKFMDYMTPVYVSALTGQRLEKVLDLACEAYEQASRRITTGLLNDVVRDAVLAVEPPSYNGKRLKILYVTQDSVCPPTFVFFVNDTKLTHFSYRRYLENCLRRAFGFKGTPIKLVFRSRDEQDI